jgi:predicted transcriptional regulator of viral defense system
METPVSNRLFELAERHGGYFTTQDALDVSISNRVLTHLISRGVLERVAHGIYRLVAYPDHPHADMLVATLWTGAGSAVSHESALAVYNLAQAAPPVLHVTVPRPFRGQRPGVRIHLADLKEGSTRVRDDVPVTSIERTLLDVARSSDRSLVREAVHESLERGLTTRRRLTLALGDVQEGRTQVRRTWGVRLSTTEDPR